MRQLLTISALLFLAVLSFAQTPNFFADGSRWVFHTQENSEPGQKQVHSVTEQNIIHGDTLISGRLYSKLYTTLHKVLTVNVPPVPIIIHSYDSTGPVFLRYDTLQKQVYYLPGVDSTERLIYDFTLQVGDTVPMQSPNFPGAFIDSVDVITLFNIQVKRFWVNIGNSGFDFFNYIVEGMGGTNGLFYFQPEFGSISGQTFTTHINCFQFGDSTMLFFGHECPFIDFISALVPLERQPTLIVGPNPARDIFTINIDPVLLDARFVLTDASGRVVKSLNLKETTADVHMTEPGIYFWGLEHNGREIKSGKIVIQ